MTIPQHLVTQAIQPIPSDFQIPQEYLFEGLCLINRQQGFEGGLEFFGEV